MARRRLLITILRCFNFEMFLIILLIIAVSATKMEPFIVGGRDASIENWPFITFIEISQYGFFTFACGGSLISSQTVLTAAHCLDDATGKKKWWAGISFRIYMGHSSYIRAKMCRVVSDYESHNDYSPSDDDVTYDIGIMFLSRPVSFSDNVQKAILQSSFSYKRDRNLVAAGWGSTDPEESRATEWLKAVQMTARKFNRCRYMYKVICTFADDEYEYPFKGDSGGPIIKADTRRQVGIVSIRDLHTGISIFTSVPEYYDWIEEIQLMLFNRNCGKK